MRQGPYEEVTVEPRPTGWKMGSYVNTGHSEMQQSPKAESTQCVQQADQCWLKNRNRVAEEGGRRHIIQNFVTHYVDFGFCSKYNGKVLMNYNQGAKTV